MDTLTVPRRFNGPPTSGNGGYVGGALAARLGAPSVQVTLRAPPPLDRPLQLRATADGGLSLLDGELLLAEAIATAFTLAVPAAPALEVAEAAAAIARMRARTRTGNPYDQCFGCGISRDDGLCIVPGPVGDDGLVAAAWTPSPSLAGADGVLPADIAWAALDCPAGIAWNHRLGNGPPMMTGRMAAAIDLPIRAGETYIVVGWPISQDGRKLHAGTAIFDGAGRVHARSLQLWLQPRT